jgi:hypothetical protein
MWPPFVNQLVLEGEGTLDLPRWQAAMDAVVARWPGACARLVGSLGWTRWVADGPPPPVVEVEATWDGRGPAPFTLRRLDPWTGPIAELLLVRGPEGWVDRPPPRVILRTHHAAFDGRATWALAEDLAAALEGRLITGAALTSPTDAELARPLSARAAPEPPADRTPPTGLPTSASTETTWIRVSVPAPAPRAGLIRGPGVLPRALAALARAAQSFTGTPLRLSVPVDLRRHHPEIRVAANLTGFVRLEVDRPDAERIAGTLAGEIARHAEVGPILTADRLRGLPLELLARAGGRAATEMLTTGRCSVSATVSNLGRIEPADVSGGGFRARRAWWIPPHGPGTPLFLTLTGHPEGIEICGGMPVGLADEGRLEQLLAGVAEGLA